MYRGSQRLVFKYLSVYVSFMWESDEAEAFSARVQTDVRLIVKSSDSECFSSTLHNMYISFPQTMAKKCWILCTVVIKPKSEHRILSCVTVAFTTKQKIFLFGFLPLNCASNSPLWKKNALICFVSSLGWFGCLFLSYESILSVKCWCLSRVSHLRTATHFLALSGWRKNSKKKTNWLLLF